MDDRRVNSDRVSSDKEVAEPAPTGEMGYTGRAQERMERRRERWEWREERRRQRWSGAGMGSWLVGLILIGLGALFLLDQMGAVSAGEAIRRGWPLLIVAVGVLQLLTARRALLGPLIVILVGLLLLAGSLDIPAFNAALFWPLALIAIGVAVLFGAWRRFGAETTGDTVSALAIFGGNRQVVRSQRFRGGALSSFFGGVDLELRQAQLAPDAELDVTAAFGGVTIRVPAGWHIVINGLPIFGGWSDKTEGDGPPPEGAPTLRVRAVTAFGGLTVKH
jgi:hypothetical protein